MPELCSCGEHEPTGDVSVIAYCMPEPDGTKYEAVRYCRNCQTLICEQPEWVAQTAGIELLAIIRVPRQTSHATDNEDRDVPSVP